MLLVSPSVCGRRREVFRTWSAGGHPCYVGELHRVVSRPLDCSLQCEDLIARVCSYRKEVFFLFEKLAFAAATGALHEYVVGWNMPSTRAPCPGPEITQRQTRLMLDWQTSWRTMAAW